MIKKRLSCFCLGLYGLALPASAGLIDLGIDLGSADKYTFAVGGSSSSMILGSEAEIFGSVASGWYLSTAPGVSIHGDACYQVSTLSPDTHIEGASGPCADSANLAADIYQANLAASLLSGFDLGAIENTLTLSAAAQHIYSASHIDLDSGEFLTIHGSANDEVVINISGNAKVASLAGISLSGGISGSNVLFNFLGNPARTEMNFGGANISGTFLATNTAYIMGDGATLDDVRFYTNDFIQANVQQVRTQKVQEVPEPSSAWLLVVGAGLFLRKRFTNK